MGKFEKYNDNGFPNYIVDEQLKCMIKKVNQQNKHFTTPPRRLRWCNG